MLGPALTPCYQVLLAMESATGQELWVLPDMPSMIESASVSDTTVFIAFSESHMTHMLWVVCRHVRATHAHTLGG